MRSEELGVKNRVLPSLPFGSGYYRLRYRFILPLPFGRSRTAAPPSVSLARVSKAGRGSPRKNHRFSQDSLIIEPLEEITQPLAFRAFDDFLRLALFDNHAVRHEDYFVGNVAGKSHLVSHYNHRHFF